MTPHERLRIIDRAKLYQKMLDIFKSKRKWITGYCSALSAADSSFTKLNELPELILYKPKKGWKRNERYWWNPRYKFIRRWYLRKAIRNCLKQLKNE